jgi:enediyne polyketide synthase
VIVVDAAGEPVVAWTGVRLQDVGPLARMAAWHPSLLAVSLESRAVGFGMDPSLRVIISTGQPLMGRRGHADPPPAGASPAAPAPAAPAPAGDVPAGDAPGTRPAWSSTAPGHGPLDGFELVVRASVPVAARWEAAGFQRDRPAPSGPALIRLRRLLLTRPGETPETADARLHAVSASLAALGREAGQDLAIVDDHGDGWIVVRSGGTLITSAVVEIDGVPELVTVAIAGGMPRPGPQARPSAGQPGLAPVSS